ncbi:MAG: RsmE family RNA methyltransferase [bacterium]
MSYFLSGCVLSEGLTFTLAGEEARHLLKSRRIKPGERFALQDPEGGRFSAELISTERGRATVRVFGPLPVPPLPVRRVVLLQAAVKDKAAEWIVQKATEMGVAGLVFFPAQYSAVTRKNPAVSIPPGAITRWERIAWEACKQSGRQFPPAIAQADGLDAVLEDHGPHRDPETSGWLLHPGGSAPEAGDGSATPLHILVGTEGGFAQAEVEAALEAGFRVVGLGANVLRSETAALTASALALMGGGVAGRDA